MATKRRSVSRRAVRRPNGFTLTEAVVLISIVGILASVAAPRFLAMSEFDAARAHRQALADLRHAQRLAAVSGCPVEVDFEASGYRLRKRSGCRTGSFDVDLVDPVTNQSPYRVTVPSGVAVSSAVDPIVIDALGHVTSSDGTTTSVTVLIGGLAIEGVGETGYFRVP